MTIAAGLFRQYDVRGVVDADLTVEAAYAIGGAYAALMRERNVSGEVAVYEVEPRGEPACQPEPPLRPPRATRLQPRRSPGGEAGQRLAGFGEEGHS